MTIPTPLQEALRDSITSGTFVDAKFWVFSKRGSKTGRVGSPRALFFNGHVAKRVQKLASLLDERKPKENLRVKFPADRKAYTSEYDYEDDSDLEDDEDDDASDLEDEPTTVPQVATEKSGNDAKSFIVEASEVKGDESSDVISVSDMESLFSESPDTKSEANPVSSAHLGKVVVIEDVAFVTFQALLRYLYTNEIEFAPWGSAERRKARARETISESYGIPKPSPKSIYRLADKYDIPELKELALQQIRQDLSRCNITEEALSKYTSWYPELRELELRQLARALLSADSDRNLGLLKEQIKAYTHGELPHAKHAISALYKLMESDESVEGPPFPATVAPNREDTSGDWAGLKKALISSLTSGTFLDSQFYAPESRSSTGLLKIRPIYFCSTVDGNFVSKLTECSSKIRSRRRPIEFTSGYDSDVGDEELDQKGPTEWQSSSKCVRENPTPADLPTDRALALKFGAAKTWSAIILYVYTGQTNFSAIGSQTTASKKGQNFCPEVGAELSKDREKRSVSHGGTTTKPCFPKSIYWLANKVGLTGLCDLAFKDIQSKLDENNIMQELFSPFTADHKRVREMEHELFQSKLKLLVEGALLSDVIESSSMGEHPHRAAAMELILERSVQRRRKGVLSEVKDTPKPAPTSRSSEEPIAHVQLLPPPPATAKQPPSQSLLDSTIAPALMVNDASPGSSALSKSPGKPKKAARNKPSANIKADPSPQLTVELDCNNCGRRQELYTNRCLSCSDDTRKCTGCGTIRVVGSISCAGCDERFKSALRDLFY